MIVRTPLMATLLLSLVTLTMSAGAETQHHFGAECRRISGTLYTNPSPPGMVENTAGMAGSANQLTVVCPIRGIDAMATPTEAIVTVNDNTDSDDIELTLKCRDTDSSSVYSDSQNSTDGSSVDVEFEFDGFATYDEGSCFVYASIPPTDEGTSGILRYQFTATN